MIEQKIWEVWEVWRGTREVVLAVEHTLIYWEAGAGVFHSHQIMNQSLAAFSSIQKPQATQKNLPLIYSVFSCFEGLSESSNAFPEWERLTVYNILWELYPTLPASQLHICQENKKKQTYNDIDNCAHGRAPHAMSVSYFVLLEKESLCPFCNRFEVSESQAQYNLYNSSSLSNELLDLAEEEPWLTTVRVLVESLSSCTSTKTCLMPWAVLAIFFGPTLAKYYETAWKALSTQLAKKVANLRRLEVRSTKQRALFSPFGGPKERKSPIERSSVLLLSADEASYFQQENVSPFIRQLRCYAQRRQMQFVLDSGPWPSNYVRVALQEPYRWAAQWSSHESKPSQVEEQEMKSLLVDLIMHHKILRAGELLSWSNLLQLYYEDPSKMTKIWSIERQLERNISMVVYLDTDVIIRPDSLHLGIIPLLLAQDQDQHQQQGLRKRPSDIFVRDSHQGNECVNIGFLAMRNTRASKILLELWRQKSEWSAFWDQSALAESLLELIGMEMQKYGHGYRSQCLHYLLPGDTGNIPYAMYCDCWQDALRDMIGPYRQRRSRVVRFVDPEELDINFVPNDVFWDHGFSLEGMHLVGPLKEGEVMKPLVVHWAGVGNQKLRHRFVKEYLKRAFNTTFDKGSCSRLPHLPRLSKFGSSGRLVRCCQNLRKKQHRLMVVDFREMCYWGCCEWRPIKANDCHRLTEQRHVRRKDNLDRVCRCPFWVLFLPFQCDLE